MASQADAIPHVAAIPPPTSDGWIQRIVYPTALAGIAGGAFGSVSRHAKVHGIANMSATYAANFAIVAGCYCGAREFVRVSRESEPDDLLNSAIGGLGSGAILGRLQAGQMGAVRYSIMFAVAGTAFDYAAIKLRPVLKEYRDSISGKDFTLPEWSPIRILDEEALAAKRAREEQLAAQRGITIREKEP